MLPTTHSCRSRDDGDLASGLDLSLVGDLLAGLLDLGGDLVKVGQIRAPDEDLFRGQRDDELIGCCRERRSRTGTVVVSAGRRQ